ncbi:MAG: NAD-glutamate dehydrogenase [Rhodospirillales bacterium RIFCSPLOWO2_12_FULL_58_28]|nr:MAG: NAD-glutamate dehydrogenase [Rhodospirillales bacterium RIFCSPLOWO2_02_FULL_58_16]OHC79357.1 MAG: NAD-glutamate dehydrogenase [Rhodospirillales bacterium RIFCSPLOWO2_12_FULL_58_28]
MLREAEKQKAELVNKVIRAARKGLDGDKAADAERFIKQCFKHVPPGDILENSPADLLSFAQSLWRLAANRSPRHANIRVFNPTPEKDGWKSDHTIIEIINDDMPFLVDTTVAELNRQGLTTHLIIHPVYNVSRSKGGKLLTAGESAKAGEKGGAESFMHIEVNRQSGKRPDEIREGLEKVTEDVRAAVDDWAPVRNKLADIIGELAKTPANVTPGDLNEVRDFLSWIHNDHFTLLGFREYMFKDGGAKTTVSIVKNSGLGILRDQNVMVLEELQDLASMSAKARDFVNKPDLLMVLKSNKISTVHRSAPLDVIGVKRLDAKGKVIGQRLFVGLFTSVAYSLSPWEIPLLKRKLDLTFKRTGFMESGHDGKALLNILSTFPRDELFQASVEHLYLTGLGILHLQDRQRVAIFVRRDEFERFVTCLVYVPRDAHTTALRLRFQEILEKAFAGKILTHSTQLGETPLARLYFVVQTTPGNIPVYDVLKIEAQLIDAACSWFDRLREALIKVNGEERGQSLFLRYCRAFRLGYTERFSAAVAIDDISMAEASLKSGEIGMRIYRPENVSKNQMWLKVYHPGSAIPLSDILPMLEHMGLKVMDEKPHSIRPDNDLVMLHDFGLETRDGSAVDLDVIGDKFRETFKRVWRGEIESDGFNVLVLGAGLAWREVVILRAYSKYLRQAGITFSQAYMEKTLTNNSGLTRLIVDLFLARFDPNRSKDTDKRAVSILKKLNEGLDAVAGADEDRILRRFINLVESTLRTNFFQKTESGAPKSYLSFKLDSLKVDELPLPRPMVEVFVYSSRAEAIHLRGGKVARGGIRWSDRREDFRTEVLGLMKAQMVKNAVIVPVGSKGGFVVKKPPQGGGREALLNEGIECYKTLMRGLLDITDNLSGDKVMPPTDVVRYDGDDPYLVVAADKGTATFSDIANGVSGDYGFWLGDAFASGGSVGYDHKKMGITARGAWESVKRHFREIGVNAEEKKLSVVGVGDMSGDVFGNGMLLSERIRLVAAFNHSHIFIDPEPDAIKSHAERKRLFALPRSNWSDYNPKLISAGGGVFERRAKAIILSPEIKKCLAIAKDKATPGELISAILRTHVDLLSFGGIGTYIKAAHETHADAGDRANDAIRINASELKCNVIAEGANMGMTQRARVEFALGGGRLNTDFIDNSAGVDCSDNEVNIKILLDQVVANGDLTMKQRNSLLASMTDEVSALVLKDNYAQTQAITLIQTQGMEIFDSQARLMRMLEKVGKLNRTVEFLPDDETLIERETTKQGFARPEIAVLMSYAKIWLYDELLNSDLPDDPDLYKDLINYFPTPLKNKYKKEIGGHRLRREIIATRITNSMINRVGGAFVHHVMEKTGTTPPEIARAYTIAREVLGLRSLWEDISALDNKVPAKAQTAMLIDINNLIKWITLWFLRNGDRLPAIGVQCAEFAAGFADLIGGLNKTLPRHYREDVKSRAMIYVDQGVPEKLAIKVAGLVNLFSGCDIVRLAGRRRLAVTDVARLYFAVGARFRMGRLRAAAEKLVVETYWQNMAVAALVEEIYGHQRALTSQILDFSGNMTDPEKAIGIWTAGNCAAIDQAEQLLTELWATEINDISMIAVAGRQLRTLAEASASS